MKNFLKNLIQISTHSVDYETAKWIYDFSVLVISIDLFFVDFSFAITYWFKRESFEDRNRWFNEYLESIFEHFEETEVAPLKKKPAAKKSNPKQMDRAKSDEPFVKTRKKSTAKK